MFQVKKAALGYCAILIVLSAISCGTNKKATRGDINSLEFGSGGGFTGIRTNYKLTLDGQLFKSENQTNVLIRVVDEKTTARLIKEVSKFKAYKYNMPENVYSYINIATPNGENNIVWGFGADKIDKKVIEFYKELMLLTK